MYFIDEDAKTEDRFQISEADLSWVPKIRGNATTPCWVVIANLEGGNQEEVTYFINDELHHMIGLAEQDEGVELLVEL